MNPIAVQQPKRSLPSALQPQPAGRRAVALYNFSGDSAKGQIDLVKDAAVVVITEHAGSGWVTAECQNKKGYVPLNYIKYV